MAHREKGGSNEIEMLAAAYLAGTNLRQIQIAKLLGISQAAVSRHLNHADAYLHREVRFKLENVPEETMQAVYARLSVGQLAQKLEKFAERHGQRAPVLRVFKCPTPEKKDQAPNGIAGTGVEASVQWRRMAELGRLAVPYIRDLMMRSDVCGVTWGGMLSATAGAIRDLANEPPWRDTPIQVIPLSGEPLGYEPTTSSSSFLAHEIGLRVNGKANVERSLAMVPAFVPDKFDEAQLEGVWKLIRLVPAYAEIFGKGRKPDGEVLAGKLDMVLSSIGPAAEPLGFGKGRLLETGNLKGEDLPKLILGDIGGILFERPGLGTAQQAKLQKVQDRWTGWNRLHLKGCLDRAAQNGKPGVVLVSVGSKRAEFLLQVVARGCVNHLIVCDALQKEMERLLDAGQA